MFKGLWVKNVVPNGNGLGVLGSKLSLTVAVIFFFYFLHGTKTTANKFSTMGFKLSSTPLKAFNLRLRSKKGLKLTLLAGLGFKEVSF